MNELPLTGSLRWAKISWIATGQTLQVPRMKYVANGCVYVQKNHFGER